LAKAYAMHFAHSLSSGKVRMPYTKNENKKKSKLRK
jgi:hypothetical protein